MPPVCLLQGVTVVLENMASVGNIVGGRLWHLRYIIDRVEDKSRIGFCIDTCHLFSSGGAQPPCAASIPPLFDSCHLLCLGLGGKEVSWQQAWTCGPTRPARSHSRRLMKSLG